MAPPLSFSRTSEAPVRETVKTAFAGAPLVFRAIAQLLFTVATRYVMTTRLSADYSKSVGPASTAGRDGAAQPRTYSRGVDYDDAVMSTVSFFGARLVEFRAVPVAGLLRCCQEVAVADPPSGMLVPHPCQPPILAIMWSSTAVCSTCGLKRMTSASSVTRTLWPGGQ